MGKSHDSTGGIGSIDELPIGGSLLVIETGALLIAGALLIIETGALLIAGALLIIETGELLAIGALLDAGALLITGALLIIETGALLAIGALLIASGLLLTAGTDVLCIDTPALADRAPGTSVVDSPLSPQLSTPSTVRDAVKSTEECPKNLGRAPGVRVRFCAPID